MSGEESPNISPFIPFPNRILMGTGPSPAHPRVLQAMSSPVIGYLDPDFIPVLDEVSALLRMVFKTDDGLAMALSGTGSAGMEAGVASLLEPDDTVIVCVCGFFGERIVEMADRVGANVVPLRSEWGRPFPSEMLENELHNHSSVKLIAVVHAETSTGVLQPLSELSDLAKNHGSLFMVDAVTSLGGMDVPVDKTGIDYCYSATQKCLGCPPGMSPAVLSKAAQLAVKDRSKKAKSWYLDLALIANYWSHEHVYHHTAPVNMIFALREALKIVFEEGLEARFARHRKNGLALRTGLEAIGLNLVVPTDSRLDQVTPFWVPSGINELDIRNNLIRDYNIEIGRGLGDFAGKVLRIGLMGESSKPEFVLSILSALENLLPRMGYGVVKGLGVDSANKVLTDGNV